MTNIGIAINYLNEIKKYISGVNIVLSSSFDDGRANSITDERIILDLLVSKFDYVELTPSRSWCDFYIRHHGDNKLIKFPVNLKVSSLKGADNAVSCAALLHAFTNIDLTLPWDVDFNNVKIFNDLLIDKKSESDKDYFFLVYNKADNNLFKDIIVNSIKGLQQTTPNASNLPFQINWANNKRHIIQSFARSWKIVIEDGYIFGVKKLLRKYNRILSYEECC